MFCALPLARTLFDVYNEISGLKNRCNKTTAKSFSLLGRMIWCVSVYALTDAIFIVISSVAIKSVGSTLSIHRRHAEKLLWGWSDFCLFSIFCFVGFLFLFVNHFYFLRVFTTQFIQFDLEIHKSKPYNRTVLCLTIDVGILLCQMPRNCCMTRIN